jgi:hypothetical protein
VSIVIEKERGWQILRLTSESISESETSQIIDGVRLALSEGIRCHGISLEAPSSSNIMIMGLLVVCEKMVRRFEGHLGLIMAPNCDEPGLRTLCESLNITEYDSEHEFTASSAEITATNQEKVRFARQQQPDILSSSRKLANVYSASLT